MPADDLADVEALLAQDCVALRGLFLFWQLSGTSFGTQLPGPPDLLSFCALLTLDQENVGVS